MRSLLLLTLFSLPLYGKTTVFWLSVDGLSPAYIEKARLPRLKALLQTSIYGSALMPVFPSITFPSHCSEATGVKVEEHGITVNNFYDSNTKILHQYPGEASLLQAEPIWQTVKRGGKRSAVENWPLSFNQTGPHAADYFLSKFDKDLSDEQRIDKILGIWGEDLKQGKNFDLIMAYIVGPDSIGHREGPDSPGVLKHLEKVDVLLGKIQDKIKAVAESVQGKGRQFIFLLTTDHGMLKVDKGVNLELLSALPAASKVRLLPGGPIAHVFLDDVLANERVGVLAKLKERYSGFPFVKVFDWDNLPQEWGYKEKHRVGDLVLVLDKGLTFVQGTNELITPMLGNVGPLGMHGYDAREVPEMRGFFMFWKYPQWKKSLNVKRQVDSLELHPTVAHLLEVAPSPQARAPIMTELKKIGR
jgi:hypothetical protein